MFLYDDKIEGTFMKESINNLGARESVLIVKMTQNPEELKKSNPKDYKLLSEKLSYLDNLAKSGFLDFNRIEVTTDSTIH